MKIELERIEEITGAQLRRLPLQREDDIYSADGVVDLEESDEISPKEGAFMLGYLQDDYS